MANKIEFIEPHGGADRLLPRNPTTAIVQVDLRKVDELWRQDRFG